MGVSYNNYPIEELGIGVRAYNALKRDGINAIGDLTSKTEDDLKEILNFGKKSRQEVMEALAVRGLRLREEDEPVPIEPSKVPGEYSWLFREAADLEGLIVSQHEDDKHTRMLHEKGYLDRRQVTVYLISDQAREFWEKWMKEKERAFYEQRDWTPPRLKKS